MTKRDGIGNFQNGICLQRHSQEMGSGEAFPPKLNLNVLSHNEPFEAPRTQNSIQ